MFSGGGLTACHTLLTRRRSYRPADPGPVIQWLTTPRPLFAAIVARDDRPVAAGWSVTAYGAANSSRTGRYGRFCPSRWHPCRTCDVIPFGPVINTAVADRCVRQVHACCQEHSATATSAIPEWLVFPFLVISAGKFLHDGKHPAGRSTVPDSLRPELLPAARSRLRQCKCCRWNRSPCYAASDSPAMRPGRLSAKRRRLHAAGYRFRIRAVGGE
jgi:hypothetical protein